MAPTSKQTQAAILFCAMLLATGTASAARRSDLEEDADYHFRGFSDYDNWKPQQSSPEVILIKQKDPGWDSNSNSMGSLLKDNLPLLAVLAPLMMVALLVPLKSLLQGPAYVMWAPPATPAPPAPPGSHRLGKKEDAVMYQEQSLAAQIMNMIEGVDELYDSEKRKD